MIAGKVFTARTIVGALLIGLVLTSGCGRHKAEPPPESEGRAGAPVLVQELNSGTLKLGVNLNGSTEARREADISAKVGGSVVAAPRFVGDTVKAGDLLLGIDARAYRAAVDQARAVLLGAEAVSKQAKRELERARQLRERERISDVELEAAELGASQAESGLLAARATLTLAELRLEDCEIRAPFDGRVTFLAADLGEQVAPGMPLTGVIDLSGILIRSSLSERDALRVREGMRVELRIPALDEELFPGRVRALGVRSDPATRSYAVEIEVDNLEGRILSGMAARVGITLDTLHDVITVPISSVVDQFGRPFVFVVEENTARRRAVTLGARSGDLVLVEEGLSPGERLIVRGQWTVRDGMQVELADPEGLN